MPEKATGAPGFAAEVESGDRLRTLKALRSHVADRIEEGVPARDLAALSLRLVQLTGEIDALEGNNDAASPEDEFAQRRAAVLSAAGVERADESGDARAAGS